MDMSMGIAGAIALGAALILMYVVLRKYTYPAVEQPFFSDPSLFILFTVGLIECSYFKRNLDNYRASKKRK